MKIVSKSQNTFDKSIPINKVQLLKHWCQMNGYIYKTV